MPTEEIEVAVIQALVDDIQTAIEVAMVEEQATTRPNPILPQLESLRGRIEALLTA